ncbi:MAG: Gmad2 immunoglobulin-like domain-containing protein [Desulfovermiculus sp.]
MPNKKVRYLAILVVVSIIFLIGYFLYLEQGGPSRKEHDPLPPKAEKADDNVWPGHVYWDQKKEQVKYQPCGEREQEYLVCAREIEDEDWFDLVDKLRQMPRMPRFVILAGKQKESGKEGTGVFHISRVLRIDPKGNCKEDHIVLENPLPGKVVTSPVHIQGKAKGSWYFEGDFPVLLTDWDGRIIAQGIASAQGDWMSEDFVPFTSRLEFDPPSYGQRGTLILRKDNPSDNPALDKALEIPLRFY